MKSFADEIEAAWSDAWVWASNCLINASLVFVALQRNYTFNIKKKKQSFFFGGATAAVLKIL